MPNEKRHTDRSFCCVNVRFANWEEGGQWARVMSARCSNVSAGGMCIYTHSPFRPGVILKISRPNEDRLTRPVTVRWCEQLDSGLYRTGISYL